MSKIFSNALFEAKERESAVSPVVGVMLMLVVTIIIAATVSAFAGGLVGTADKAPQAAFDVKINTVMQDWYSYLGEAPFKETTMVFTHLGGDPIDTARTKIIASWANRTTKEVYYRETTALPYSATPQNYGYGLVNLSLAEANCNSTTYKYQEPYLVIPGDVPADGNGEEVSLWYGNFILHPGDVMKVHESLSSYEHVASGVGYDTSSWAYNVNGYEKYSVIKNSEWLTGKDVVNVKLVDIPTGQIIYDKDIYVTEG